ncbi:MAG: ATP-dependent RNA helicase HrpA [Betaproteobacteria bacterium RIFCSPLOWO2_02_FULL_65_24]|nr:MAG: ATP-dependent RNA helicase HrpA [Betaproteobacteria bacterium RIFCSPLOWO2_02_FULL_65_24]
MPFSPSDIEARRRALPRPEFPPELPVSARRADIAAALSSHQVIIVAGETGSGKTTQLPKICLELGRGIHGMIGHTQPRRIAARSTAARIAQELKTELGRAVGYKIRFTDKVNRQSYVKLMTDGILLAETQGDPQLRQYDTIILDEAHERSLNIDFLLGYLKQLLPRRPELKLIVTSATIDAERFSKHFAVNGHAAPVIEVSGRLYPVEMRYRPFDEHAGDDYDLNQAISDAVDELARLGPGDVLVFLPGEREIREAAETLRKHHPPHTEILPLYARLSAAEQERIFKPHAGRRIVLATNVAETSLTVPGIRYVIDSGLARVKRYSYRNKVEQLRVEKISQAAARQRAGRCGRMASGACVRLYDEEDYSRRPPYTDPEVLRSSLAAVILKMKSLGLAEIEDFPFLDAPASKAIADGYALLQELGAVDEDRALTGIGRELARLPVDPRIGRMIFAARSEASLAEVLVIAAAMSVQDPRERPMDRGQAADEAQKRFDDEKSDFLAYLKLWKFFQEALDHKKSNAKLRELCHAHFLSYLRLREWRDIHAQLKELVSEMGWRAGELKSDVQQAYASIHRALLTGLLGNAGMKTEEGNYLGARGIKFWIHPGSGVSKKAGRWIMAGEITETTRLYARSVATIEPLWLEALGAHLVKRHRSDPHWEKKAASAMALERGTLYGLPLYVNRRVHYGPIDPVHAREIFIREALVGGEYETRASFFLHNHRLVRDIEELEHKSRRPDVLVDEELIYAFYDSAVPHGICTGAAFEAWRRQAETKDPKLLFLKREDLMRHEAAGITTAQFPPHIEMAGRSFALEYRHEPGSARDGVTLTVPLVALNQVSATRCDWLVPGLRREKAVQLAKSLPQKLRHRLGPLAQFAESFLASEAPGETTMAEALAKHARRELGLAIAPDAFRPEAMPAHLCMNFRVVDEHGRQLAMGRNLAHLKAELGERAGEQFAQVAGGEVAQAGLTDWSFGDLEEVMEIRRGSQTVIGYPALVDEGSSVALEVLDAEERARNLTRAGLRRLFMLQLKDQAKYVEKNVPQALALQYAVLQENAGDAAELKAQLLNAAFDRAFLAEPWPRNRAEFEHRCDEGRSRVALIAQELARLAAAILGEYQALQKKLAPLSRAFPVPVREMEEWAGRLLHRRFIKETLYERLQHFPRYLKAAALRLDKLRADPARDARAAAELAPLVAQWQREQARQAKAGGADPQLEQFRWLLEELRVQLFAQELRTPVPVSVKRLQKSWQAMQR